MRIVLTARDHELIQTIASYGLLTSKQIADRFFSGVRLTTVLRRLRALEASGLIQQTVATSSFDRCWFLTDKARDKFDFTSAKIHFPKAILDHDLMLSRIRLELEKLGIARSWVPEHEIRRRVVSNHGLRNSKRRVIPDGIMGVDRGTKESIAVELELSTKNQKRYREIFIDYSDKKNLWAVWYLVPNDSMRKQILKGGSEFIVFRDVRVFFSDPEDVLKNGVNAIVKHGTHSYRMHQIWHPIKAREPAHDGDHQVSEEETGKLKTETKLSTEQDTKLLMPTG